MGINNGSWNYFLWLINIIVVMCVINLTICPIVMLKNQGPLYFNNKTSDFVNGFSDDSFILMLDNVRDYCSTDCDGCYNRITNLVFVESGEDNQSCLNHELGHKFYYEVMSKDERKHFAELINHSCYPAITDYADISVSEEFAESVKIYYNGLESDDRAYMNQTILKLNPKIVNFLNFMFDKYDFPVLHNDSDDVGCIDIEVDNYLRGDNYTYYFRRNKHG